jgi:hypothetical protein
MAGAKRRDLGVEPPSFRHAEISAARDARFVSV